MNYDFFVRDPSPLSGLKGPRDFDRPTGHRNTTIRITAFHALYLLLDTTGSFERKRFKHFYRFNKNIRKALSGKGFHLMVQVAVGRFRNFFYILFFYAPKKTY